MTAIKREVIVGPCRLLLGDCREIVPKLGRFDAVVTDPPYGMNKGDWDTSIPEWLPLVAGTPTAAFCGVIGMRDYPTPDWVGAWVRLASTQRNGRLQGFNNWEPILYYSIDKLPNDVISVPNIHEDTGHPTTKPTQLMVKLVERLPAGHVLDPFMGSGTTGVACIKTGRRFTGIEIDEKYFDIAVRRCREAWGEGSLFHEQAKADADLFAEAA